ncbi:MAG: RHS repeat-associated core domain-containing protein [Minicystis sp.]
MLGIAGCLGDARPEQLESAGGNVTAAEQALLAGAADAQTLCEGGFAYEIACHKKGAYDDCPSAGTASCAPYSAGLDPACSLTSREARTWSTTVPGKRTQAPDCIPDIYGIPHCELVWQSILDTTCEALAQNEIARLLPEDAAQVTFTATQGETQTHNGKVWADCDVAFGNWPVYTKTLRNECRTPGHELETNPSICGDLRTSPQNITLAEAQQEAQGAWEALGGIGPVPYRLPPVCTSDALVLPTDRQNGQTPGVIEGAASVSAEGAAQYSMPLWLPEGRAGLAPTLSLTYSSRGGNGLLGVGFSLSELSQITLCPKTLAQDGQGQDVQFTTDDRFCLDGQRLVAVNGAYGADGTEYRLENDNFTKIVGVGTFHPVGPVTFRAYLKDGRILTFGGGGRYLGGLRMTVERGDGEPIESSPQGVHHTWPIARMEDRAGNYVDYDYETAVEGGADLWPTQIRWTGHLGSGLAPQRSVRFFYTDDRPDVEERYVSGMKMRSPRRLSRLEMWGPSPAEPALLRSYHFSYANTSITGRSQLTQVEECDGTGACKRPTKFEWTQGSWSFDVKDTGIAVDRFNAQGQSVTIDAVYPANFYNDGLDGFLYHTSENKWGGAQIPDSEVTSTRVVDLDGDGRSELFMIGLPPGAPTNASKRWMRYGGTSVSDNPVWDGDNTELDRMWSSSSEWEPGYAPLYFADIDGDGLPEALRLLDYDNKWAFRTNTNGTLGNVHIELPVSGHRDAQSYVARVDRSGRTAVLTREFHALQDGIDTYLNALTVPFHDAAGTVLRTDPTTLLSRTRTGEHRRYWFADVNGDGLSDAVNIRAEGGEPYLHINSGNGFRIPIQSPLPPELQAYHLTSWYQGDPPGVFVADFNFDGKDDILIAQGVYPGAHPRSKWVLWKSTGNGFVGQELPVSLGPLDPTSAMPVHAMLLDYNGDGLTDIVGTAMVSGGLNMPLKRELVVQLRKGPLPDLLTATVNGAGARSEFGYRPLKDDPAYMKQHRDRIDRKLPPVALPQKMTRPSMWVAYELKQDNGKGGFNRYTHTYADGREDLLRGWLGFGSHTVKNEQTGATTTTEYDVSTRVGTAYPLAGKPIHVRSQVTLGSQWTHVSEVSTHYQVTQSAGGEVYVALPDHIVSVNVQLPPQQLPPAGSSWLPGAPSPGVAGAVITGADVAETHDGDGNLTRRFTKRMAGGPATNGGLQYTGEEQDLRTTYKPRDPGSWLVGLPEIRYVQHRMDASTTVTRTVSFDHDPTGLLRTETVEPWGYPDAYLRTEYHRNAFGLPDQVTASSFRGQSRTETIDYDSLEQMFPIAVTNALGHTTRTEYHPGLGVATADISPNNLRVEATYDGFGRVRAIDNPAGVSSTTHYGFRADGLVEVLTTSTDGGHGAVYLDKLGRDVERRSAGFDGLEVVERKEYDALGRRTKVSVPRTCLASEQPLCLGAEQWTSFTYDELSRPLLETRPDSATIQRVYVANRIDTIDARNQASYVLYDAAGRIVESAEGAPGSAVLRTTFSYAPFDLPRQVQVIEGTQVRLSSVMTYDQLGRRTLLEERYSGSSAVGYREQSIYEDALGRRVRDINAKGQETVTDFDALGRVVHKHGPDGDAAYTWDTAPGAGIGRPASYLSTDEGVRVDYSYDPLGRLGQSSWTLADPLLLPPVSHDTYVVDRQYDALGRLVGIDYPAVPNHARFHVTYAYNGTGNLQAATDGDGHLLWRAEGVNALGQLTDERFGNDVISHRTYDPLRHVLRRIDTHNPANEAVQQLGFDFDATGNLTLRQDDVAQLHEVFGYDPENRLESWSVQGPSGDAQHVFHYDGLGRLTARQVVAGDTARALTLDYDDSGAHNPYAPIASNLGTYDYDANGNQTGAPRRAVDYTAFGLPRQVNLWHETARYAFGPGNRRVLKCTSNDAVPPRIEVTAYIEGLYERRYQADQAEHVFHVQASGRTVAHVTWKEQGGSIISESVGYLHDDHLGSPEAITDAAGAVKARLRFDPLGERADVENPVLPAGAIASGEVRLGFTGHEMEDDLGLINMKGRVYDPKIGHFLSRDPMVQSPFDPRSYNRYAYAGYNPLSITDPTGFAGEQPYLEICYPSCGGSAQPPSWGIPLGPVIVTVPFGSGGSSGGKHTKGSDRGRANGVDDNAAPPAGPEQGATVASAQSEGASGDQRSGWQKFKDGHYFGTGLGEDAAMEYARMTTNPDATAIDIALGWTGGLFASLWTRDTYLDTVGTLMMAGELNASLKGAAKAAELGGQQAAKTLRSCFAADTLVLTRDGDKPISEVQVGDEVWAFDPKAGTWDWQRVTRTFVHEHSGPMVVFSDGDREIRVTPNHPICIEDGTSLDTRAVPSDIGGDSLRCSGAGRWVRAGDLQPGDLGVGASTRLALAALERVEESRLVYNLEVAGAHTYVVGSARLLVHNKAMASGTRRVVQSGGNKMSSATADALNEAAGSSLKPREWGRALEALKKDLGLSNNHHGKIFSNGDYVSEAGEILGNILDYIL